MLPFFDASFYFLAPFFFGKGALDGEFVDLNSILLVACPSWQPGTDQIPSCPVTAL